MKTVKDSAPAIKVLKEMAANNDAYLNGTAHSDACKAVATVASDPERYRHELWEQNNQIQEALVGLEQP